MFGRKRVMCLLHHLLFCMLSSCALGSPDNNPGEPRGSIRNPGGGHLGSDTHKQSTNSRLFHSQIRHDRGSNLQERFLPENRDISDIGLQHVLLKSWRGRTHVDGSAESDGSVNLKTSSIIKRDRLRRRESPLAPKTPQTMPPLSDQSSAGPLSAKDALAIIEEVKSRPKAGECAGTDIPGPVLELENKFPSPWTEYFQAQSQKAISTANVLNNVFQVWDSKTNTLYNKAFFYSLAKGFLSPEDTSTVGATIAFDRNQYLVYPPNPDIGETPSQETFAPHVKRGDTKEPYQSLDIAELTKNKYTGNGTMGYGWFWRQRKQYPLVLWDDRSMCNRSRSAADEALGYTADSVSGVTTTANLGLWTAPYYDCQRTGRWVITYSVPFFGCNIMDQLLFKGVVAVDIALDSLDVNQCNQEGFEDSSNQKYTGNPIGSVYAGTHKCRPSTQCVFVPGYGFRLGGYKCVCSPGFYYPGSSNSDADNYYEGRMVETAHRNKILNISHSYDIGFHCDQCAKGCGEVCHDSEPCYVDYDDMIRAISVGVVSFCMSVCLVLAIVVVRMRKTKVMKASMWILLEIILLGSLFLYATVIIQYFEPTDVTCILVPWCREVGFAIVYGSIILKIYRILSEFQSRKAHRVHVRDKDLLKYILTVVILVVGFMAAWTAVNLDYVIKDEASLVTKGHLEVEDLSFAMCREMWWEYVVELGEFLLLVFGIYLCYRIRAAPSEYMERRYLSLAIYNETVVSTLTHIMRHFLWGIVHPDYIFLMYLIRCQLTVSLCLIMVLGPKLWYAHRPPEDDHFRNRTYSASDVQDNVLPESMKLHAGVNSNGDVDVTEINLSEMDPEDIRSELKRLYTQLQIYKTKTMRKDNPHISKRRGGRKQTHRRFSLQAFHHKHRHHHEHDHDHELSKTPEESTNSAEGVAYSIEESTCSVGEMTDKKTPTVTFKPGHKSFY